jgi:UDP-N-acetylglucosamine 2-epimerase
MRSELTHVHDRPSPVLLAIIGARPQFIKHAVVQYQLRQHCSLRTLHTGQHYDALMSDAFFEELGIPEPEIRLDLSAARSHSAQTGLMMSGIEEAAALLCPDAFLLYGDTNSTLAGALVAAKMQIPAIHVEAGIRSYNRAMPEEVNRIVADTFAALLFCPVQQAVGNLHKEGISHAGIFMTGDVMCDMLELSRSKITLLHSGPYYFATIHRPYNTDSRERLVRILRVLNDLDHPVIFPLHPRTAKLLETARVRNADYENIRFIPPVGYMDSISYQAGAACIITDSGGIQKEAYMLRKKCITLRSETEWEETLEYGWNVLVFDDIERISHLVREEPGIHIPDMFGDGHASERIARIITEWLGAGKYHPQIQSVKE